MIKPFQEHFTRETRKKQIQESLPVGMIIMNDGQQVLKDAHIQKSAMPGWLDIFASDGEIFSMPGSAIQKIIWQDDWKNYKGDDVEC